jgi:hypothetical protein
MSDALDSVPQSNVATLLSHLAADFINNVNRCATTQPWRLLNLRSFCSYVHRPTVNGTSDALATLLQQSSIMPKLIGLASFVRT